MNREETQEAAVDILQLQERRKELQAEIKLVNERIEERKNASRDETDKDGGALLGHNLIILVGPRHEYLRMAHRPARALIEQLVDQGLVDPERLRDDRIFIVTQRRGAVRVISIVDRDDAQPIENQEAI